MFIWQKTNRCSELFLDGTLGFWQVLTWLNFWESTQNRLTSPQLWKQDEGLQKKKKKWLQMKVVVSSDFIWVWLQAVDWKPEWQHTYVFDLESAWNETGRKRAGVASGICLLLIQAAAAASALHPLSQEGIYSTCCVRDVNNCRLWKETLASCFCPFHYWAWKK